MPVPLASTIISPSLSPPINWSNWSDNWSGKARRAAEQSGKAAVNAVASYGIGVISVLVALLVRLAADPTLGARQPFPTFYVAVAVTAWFCRWPAAVLAGVLGFLAGNWFFLPPRHAITFAERGDVAGAALYAMVCGSLILLTELTRRAERRSAGHLEQVAREAQERSRSEAALRASEARQTEVFDFTRS